MLFRHTFALISGLALAAATAPALAGNQACPAGYQEAVSEIKPFIAPKAWFPAATASRSGSVIINRLVQCYKGSQSSSFFAVAGRDSSHKETVKIVRPVPMGEQHPDALEKLWIETEQDAAFRTVRFASVELQTRPDLGGWDPATKRTFLYHASSGTCAGKVDVFSVTSESTDKGLVFETPKPFGLCMERHQAFVRSTSLPQLASLVDIDSVCADRKCQAYSEHRLAIVGSGPNKNSSGDLVDSAAIISINDTTGRSDLLASFDASLYSKVGCWPKIRIVPQRPLVAVAGHSQTVILDYSGSTKPTIKSRATLGTPQTLACASVLTPPDFGSRVSRAGTEYLGPVKFGSSAVLVQFVGTYSESNRKGIMEFLF